MTEPFCIDALRERLRARKVRTEVAAQRASVAMILAAHANQLHLLFIQRAEHPADPWSGHMALPGGRRDRGDESDLATATRETLEEVGIDLTSCGELLGALDNQRASSAGRPIDMVIAPFVFYVKSLTPVVISNEVVATHWAPLGPIFNGQAETQITVTLSQGRAKLPAWDVGGKQVWGLTYRMVKDLFSVLGPVSPDQHPCP